jgi:alkylation response protein AidB-like acyl-CoA dehydrogenase
VNLELDEDQRALVRATTEVCESLAPDWRNGSAPNLNGLKELGSVGILGVRHPEPDGSGLGPVEAALVAQVCGAALAPTAPLVWADLVGPAVPGTLSGAVSVAGALAPNRAISYGGSTDVTVLIDDEGARVFNTDALDWTPVPDLDPGAPRAVVRIPPAGEGTLVADPERVRQWRWQFCILAAAHLVGIGGGAVDASVAYAKDRHQFGKPIGSFQAIKHLLADAYTAVELARSQVLIASLCWAEGDAGASEQAAAAALVAVRAAVLASETAIQVHGGMGFTSETIPHLYYKRTLTLQDDLGGSLNLVRQLAERDLTLAAAASAR